MKHPFDLSPAQLEPLIAQTSVGMATNKIVVDGEPVGFCYREAPDHDADSGWRFLTGREKNSYINDPDNWDFFALNAFAHYDAALIPLLNSPIFTAFVRVPGTNDFRQLGEDELEEGFFEEEE